jgi:hypothetical protein
VSRRWDTILVGGLTVAAAIRPALFLRPHSLWLDDAWPALVVKADSLRDFLLAAGTAPGFALLLRTWLGVVGFTELHAQMLPFVAGVAAPPLLYVVALRRGFAPRPAMIATALLSASAVRATYSTHVKQYSIELLIAVLILFVSLGLVDRRSSGRLWFATAGSCVIATVFSGSLAVVAAPRQVVAAQTPIVRRSPHRTRAVVLTVGFAVFALMWWAAIIRPAVNPALVAFWEGHYIELDGVRALSTTVVGLRRLFFQFVPSAGTAWIPAAFFVAGLVRLFQRDRAVASVLGLPVVAALALAAAHRAPIGTRTDQYLYAFLALATAIGVDEAISLVERASSARRRHAARALAVALVLALAAACRSSPYPLEDVKPIVRRIERTSTDEAVVIYWPTAYAFGLYTRWPIHLVRAAEAANGFTVAVDRPGAHVLPLHSENPEHYRDELAPLIARYRRIWFVASHLIRSDDVYVTNDLYDAGYRLQTAEWADDAYAMLWTCGGR